MARFRIADVIEFEIEFIVQLQSQGTVRTMKTRHTFTILACVVASGGIPDSRHMSAATHEQFEDIVVGGAYQEVGMPRFDEELGSAGLAALRADVIEQAHEDEQLRNGNPVWHAIKQAVYSTLA